MAVFAEPMSWHKAHSRQERCCCPVGVEKERISADGIVELAGQVVEQRECAASGVVRTGGVAQKRRTANARHFICGIDKERRGADTCVEIARAVA